MASNAFTQCRDLALPRPPSDLQLQNSAAASALMKSMGIQACTSTEAVGGFLPYIVATQVATSVGCEQVAALIQSIDQSQRAIQCTVSKVSQSSSTAAIAANNILINLSGNAVITCLTVQQDIDLKIATNVEFGSQVKTSMANDLESTIKSFANVVQNSEKDALSTPAGNKAATLFASYLEQTSFQGSFEEIIQKSIQDFQATNTFTLNMTGYSMIGLANPPSNLLVNNCLTITQAIVMQVFSSTILDSALQHVFDNQLASDWSSAWIAEQHSKANQLELVDITNLASGIIAVVIVVIIIIVVVFMVMKGGGNNSLMSSSSGQPGQKGVTIAAIIISIGIILFFVGIGLLAAGLSTWGGGICIAAGLIAAGLGGYLLWRANQVKSSTAPAAAKT